jgi:hypothetical protein
MLWGRGPWLPPSTALGGYGRHFRSRGRHPTDEEMAHWILRWAGCSHNKCATRHAAIGLMRWTNEGEGQLRNIPSCPKIIFIVHSAAWGGRGAWVHPVVGGDDMSSFMLTSALDAVRSTCVRLQPRHWRHHLHERGTGICTLRWLKNDFLKSPFLSYFSSISSSFALGVVKL